MVTVGSTTSCGIATDFEAGEREAKAAPLAGAFAAAWHRYRVKIGAIAILRCIASVTAGRVWRFPFGDELGAMVPLSGAVSMGDDVVAPQRWDLPSAPEFSAVCVSL